MVNRWVLPRDDIGGVPGLEFRVSPAAASPRSPEAVVGKGALAGHKCSEWIYSS